VSFLSVFFISPRRAKLGGVTRERARGMRSAGAPPPTPTAGPWQELI
jgi:hypothetical protein